MSKKIVLKPVAAALGAAFVGSLAGTSIANAAENPFVMSELASGYMVADTQMPEGKCGEGMMGKEGKCGEAKCGMSMMDANSDGQVTKEEFMSGHEKMFAKQDKNGDGVLSADEMKMKEGKCGEGKCGEGMKEGAAKMKEGKCGEGKCGEGMKEGAAKMKEGKCGEGKCGEGMMKESTE